MLLYLYMLQRDAIVGHAEAILVLQYLYMLRSPWGVCPGGLTTQHSTLVPPG